MAPEELEDLSFRSVLDPGSIRFLPCALKHCILKAINLMYKNLFLQDKDEGNQFKVKWDRLTGTLLCNDPLKMVFG